MSEWDGAVEEARERTLRPGRPCGVRVVYLRLSADGRQGLQVMLETPTISARAISGVLADRDIHLSVPSITRHRRGECRCGK